MTERTYQSSIPLDVLRLGADGRVKTSDTPRDPNFYIVRGEDVELQFLVHPSDNSGTGWFPYRMASVKSILVPGVWSTGQYSGSPRADLPWQLRDVVVEDTKLVQTASGQSLYNFTRPRLEVSPGRMLDVKNEILDGRSQNFAERNQGRLRAEFQVLVNAIVWDWPETKKKDGSAAARPDVGQHIGLKFSQVQANVLASGLEAKVKEAKREGIDIDILKYRWIVNFSNGKNSQLTLIRGDKITEPLDVEPFDFSKQVMARLMAFEEHVRAAYADLNGPSPDQMLDQAEATKVDEIEDNEATSYFDNISTSALRTRIKAAGVDIPAGTTRSTLIGIAKDVLNV